MGDLKIIYKKVEDLIPYINNPRHNDEAVDKVASSIKNFGFKVPIVIDKDNEIITGHTRLRASKKLGLEEVPCIVADDLTDGQIKAFRIADNKVAEFSDWDMELLNSELKELEDLDLNFDMDDFGFEFEDLDAEDVQEDDFDIDAELEKEPISKPGEIYQLGEHRLMCGDSTSEEDIQKLVGGGYSSRFASYRPTI
ncbi:MAG: ParB N-terminal domain-containing protein [Peptoniphilus sp. oral taxon 375]|nr:ParB N-terminal domain-containing protein [Peptoniphilus sp. oral taxon 375]